MRRVLVAAVLLLGLAGCSSVAVAAPGPEPTMGESSEHQVTFMVSGDGPVTGNVVESVTTANGYKVMNGSGLTLPYSETQEIEADTFIGFNQFSLTAEVMEGSSTITCQIFVDGVAKVSRTANGVGEIAKCLINRDVKSGHISVQP